MKILGFGLDFKGKPLFKPVDGATFEQSLIDALGRNAEHLQRSTRATSVGFAVRGELERKIVNLGDPVEAGWSFLVNNQDPQRGDIEGILEPLARHRGMSDPKSPLVFNEEPPEDWFDWLHDSYYALDLEGKKAPHYILIVGGPERIPFRFQSLLDT